VIFTSEWEVVVVERVDEPVETHRQSVNPLKRVRCGLDDSRLSFGSRIRPFHFLLKRG